MGYPWRLFLVLFLGGLAGAAGVAGASGLYGVAALAFAYVFWTCGLEAAMPAHVSGDLVLHVIGPAFVGT